MASTPPLCADNSQTLSCIPLGTQQFLHASPGGPLARNQTPLCQHFACLVLARFRHWAGEGAQPGTPPPLQPGLRSPTTEHQSHSTTLKPIRGARGPSSQARKALGEQDTWGGSGCRPWQTLSVAKGSGGAREAGANLTGEGTSAAVIPPPGGRWCQRPWRRSQWCRGLGRVVSGSRDTMATIQSETDCYDIIEVLGKGTFGEVAKGWRRSTGEMVAIKILKNDAYRNRIIKNELKLLRCMRGLDPEEAHVIRFLEFFHDALKFYLVFELLEQNLFEFQKENNFAPLPACHIRTVTLQVLRALARLKELAIIHADLKPENIMLVDQTRCPFRVKRHDIRPEPLWAPKKNFF
ncbi:hypothetical protein P7K49_034381 [Saguinus oedipus]|uniref:Protein kinase domain-containing protein n=1 Tax=Saguinus oedipus TaxID=9490 RepID=A0ABQ9TUL3_SAGOE|nr:hypothetical protein P7K49_034381 [Saguinus oedipus]